MMDDLFDRPAAEPGKPYYPDRPGFEQGSATSADAADSLDDGLLTKLRLLVYQYVLSRSAGATCDEIEIALDLRHQTASARCRELFLAGWIYTTEETRLTRSRRSALVYRARRKAAAS